jgi:2-C-methyl-D-erythritol 2,4-cyclodiphosphate synthase
MMDYRVGFGYDVHRLSPGRKMVVGGVEIPYHSGPEGHSDADVLLHAICDALLGAAALGDIGTHFPDNDPAYKDIQSILLLERVYGLLLNEGYRVVNIDATVVLEVPKIMTYSGDMRKKIASALKCTEKAVSIKATTSEGMGFAGKREGMEAYAVVMIRKEGE